jgi:AraC family transcriptional regulator
MKSDFDFFHGTVLKSSTIAGLSLTETAYASNIQLPKHSHNSAYFCYVIKGGFTEVYGKRSLDCDKSLLIFHPAGEMHADFFHASSRCFNLKISSQWLERIQQFQSTLSEPVYFRRDHLSHLAAKLYKEFKDQDELSSLVIEGLALEILGETARRQVVKPLKNTPSWLAQARDLIHDRFQENPSLAEIASTVGVHETHLAREFRRFYSMTVGEYIRSLRIEFACRQLCESDASIAEIALAAGFFDQSHFGRTFNKLMGISPNAYRKMFCAR